MNLSVRCMLLFVVCFSIPTQSADMTVVSSGVHLRSGDAIEWSQFVNNTSPEKHLDLVFQLTQETPLACLRIDQRDVKAQWKVLLNEKSVGSLVRDENAQTIYLDIPKETLKIGENRLQILTTSKQSDDVVLGPVVLLAEAQEDHLNGSEVSVSVTEKGSASPLPCRLTVINDRGFLQSTSAKSNDSMAVRAGVIYCAGKAEFSVPPGRYQIIASRGPEYGIQSTIVDAATGEPLKLDLELERQVDTSQYVACDTHVHTREYSGHGDATVGERVLTLAGEAVELPITTEHNKHHTYAEHAHRQGLSGFFTPVTGNEFTTKVGHFNIFPTSVDVAPPDYRSEDWEVLFRRIFGTRGVQIVILNHPRDLHGGFRPFGPENRHALVMRDLNEWDLRANAMEVINSGAQQTDMMLQVIDWMRLLNRGMHLTPIGSSDSHDVSRYIVGQGRTYIRVDDESPGSIDVAKAVDRLAQGQVHISLGLFCQLSINRRSSGQLVAKDKTYHATVTVSGPDWVTAKQLQIYRNAELWTTAAIEPGSGSRGGTKFEFSFSLEDLQRDEHVVAIATGETVDSLHWPIAKPYQPTSTDWSAKTMGISGAVWIDADGDGVKTSALDYAKRLARARGFTVPTFEQFADLDRAQIMMVADQLTLNGFPPDHPLLLEALKGQSEQIRSAFKAYQDASRQSIRARVEQGLPPAK